MSPPERAICHWFSTSGGIGGLSMWRALLSIKDLLTKNLLAVGGLIDVSMSKL